jgi:hypothetical protein
MTNLDLEKLSQNALMEANGNEAYARLILAGKIRALNDYAERLEDKSSFGFHRWPPRKPHKPMVLDSIEPLDLAEEKHLGLAEGR